MMAQFYFCMISDFDYQPVGVELSVDEKKVFSES